MSFGIYVNDPKARFSAAHFLVNHQKCSRIHGHNYTVCIKVKGVLNEKNFVVDFFEMKERLRAIADELDHAILLPEKSNEMKITFVGTQVMVDMGEKHFEFPKSDVRLLPLEATTSELLAKYIHDRIKPSYPNHELIVEVGETDGNIAFYTK
jgi:6-pyruvoyltetrahydropterin/6-carboxytetrahydropterin synthase